MFDDNAIDGDNNNGSVAGADANDGASIDSAFLDNTVVNVAAAAAAAGDDDVVKTDGSNTDGSGAGAGADTNGNAFLDDASIGTSFLDNNLINSGDDANDDAFELLIWFVTRVLLLLLSFDGANGNGNEFNTVSFNALFDCGNNNCENAFLDGASIDSAFLDNTTADLAAADDDDDDDFDGADSFVGSDNDCGNVGNTNGGSKNDRSDINENAFLDGTSIDLAFLDNTVVDIAATTDNNANDNDNFDIPKTGGGCH